MPLFAAEVLEVTASNEVILGTFAGEIQVWKPLAGKSIPRRSVKYGSVGMDTICVLGRDLGVSPVGGLTELQLWNPSTASLGPTIHVAGGGVTALAPFGARQLLCGTKGGRISIFDVDGLRAQMGAKPPGSVYSIASFDDKTVVSSSAHGHVHLWNVADGTLMRTLEGHSGSVHSVCACGPDRIASTSADNTIRTWSASTGQLLRTMQSTDKPGIVTALIENHLAVAPVGISKPDLPIRIWNTELGQEMAAFPPFPGGVGAMVSRAGRFLLFGTYDGAIFHLEISTEPGPRNFRLLGHERGVCALTFIGINRIASGSLDKTIRIWDLTTQGTVRVLQGHEAEITGLVFLPSGLLASVSADHTVRIWDPETGGLTVSLQIDTGLSSLAVVQNEAGVTLVAGGINGVVHFFRLEVGHQ